MTTTAAKLTVWKVEDHEGTGECSECGKTGLRWVTFLSDGSRVGGECAKRILGWAPTKSKFSWLTGMTVVDEKAIHNGTGHAVLMRSESGRTGVMAVNGNAIVSGPFEWVAKQFANEY
jgi:hypothetical protein